MSNRRRGQEARFQVNFLYGAGDMTSFPCAEREQALAHVIADETGAAYRRSDALAKRRLLMDQWATTVVLHTTLVRRGTNIRRSRKFSNRLSTCFCKTG
jgi:hypothetical protein